MTPTPTKEQIAAVLGVVRAVADVIRELGEVPSGHLYAQVMGQLSLSEYNRVIEMLIKGGMVKQRGDFMLVWIGPKTTEHGTVVLK